MKKRDNDTPVKSVTTKEARQAESISPMEESLEQENDEESSEDAYLHQEEK